MLKKEGIAVSFGWINLVNAAFVVDLIVMSALGQKKSGLPPMQSRRKLRNVLEQIGRFACMALMILPLLPGLKFGFASFGAMVGWLVGALTLLLAYLLLWTQAKRGGAVLYGLAVVPALLFLCCGVLLRHWALAAAAILFGIFHTLIVQEYLQTKQNEEEERASCP